MEPSDRGEGQVFTSDLRVQAVVLVVSLAIALAFFSSSHWFPRMAAHDHKQNPEPMRLSVENPSLTVNSTQTVRVQLEGEPPPGVSQEIVINAPALDVPYQIFELDALQAGIDLPVTASTTGVFSIAAMSDTTRLASAELAATTPLTAGSEPATRYVLKRSNDDPISDGSGSLLVPIFVTAEADDGQIAPATGSAFEISNADTGKVVASVAIAEGGSISPVVYASVPVDGTVVLRLRDTNDPSRVLGDLPLEGAKLLPPTEWELAVWPSTVSTLAAVGYTADVSVWLRSRSGKQIIPWKTVTLATTVHGGAIEVSPSSASLDDKAALARFAFQSTTSGAFEVEVLDTTFSRTARVETEFAPITWFYFAAAAGSGVTWVLVVLTQMGAGTGPIRAIFESWKTWIDLASGTAAGVALAALRVHGLGFSDVLGTLPVTAPMGLLLGAVGMQVGWVTMLATLTKRWFG